METAWKSTCKIIAADGRVLDFLHESEDDSLFTGNFQLDENIFAGGVAQHRVDVASRNLQRLRLYLLHRK